MSKRTSDAARGPSTQAVHAGEDRRKPWDSLTTPIYQTATFVFHDTETVRQYTAKKLDRFEYGRYSGPTERAAGRKLAALEGADDVLLFASGMPFTARSKSCIVTRSSLRGSLIPQILMKRETFLILSESGSG